MITSENMPWTGLALSEIIKASNAPVCIITPDTLTAFRLEEELTFFCPEATENILHLPDWETLPYDCFSPHQDIVSERLKTLYRLPSLRQGAIITPVSSLMHRLCARDYLEAHSLYVQTNDQLDLDQMRERLTRAGYRTVSQVREHGEFAIRGAIIDLYPMGCEYPFRIELIDDVIESIRTFSTDTQLSIEHTDRIELLPAREIPLTESAINQFRQTFRRTFSGNPLNCPVYTDVSDGIFTQGLEYYLPLFFTETTLFTDWLPKQTLIVQVGNTKDAADIFWHEITNRYEQLRHDIQRPLLKPEALFVPVNETLKHLASYQHQTVSLSARPLGDYPKKLIENTSSRILFCTETAGRREIFISQLPIRPKLFETWSDFIASDEKIGITLSPLEKGFILDSPAITLMTENDWAGHVIIPQKRRRDTTVSTDNIFRSLDELQEGTAVVHIDHGIGRYLGLKILSIGGIEGEYLSLEFADGDRLYVPVSSLHLISRYSGVDPDKITLSKLGSGHWHRARKKALEDMRDTAAELLDVYAKRAASKGYKCDMPEKEYAKFANAFPFEETPDQKKAIEEIIHDLQSGKPMDRLVCGDVGFGKTEVAMRAAFIAVQAGKQVAVLVPTTLLAEQHWLNFLDRFADWPIQVEMLSRFRNKEQQTNTLENIKLGKTDIVIGTHQLLQKNILFKDLGLIIIDEEHRFGVRHKEILKSKRLNVHILNLTATPIPRTLNMAFSGIRDLSIIATPPRHRLSVKTFVQEYQPSVIKDAIQREIFRGGQVYFLHNEVDTIDRAAREISTLVPEARVGIAHGQMRERNLESVMSDFYHRRFNVLVCSTIIESGIDIPTANTIIIQRADRFGLAQLHQLRGRVGRSHHQAYAWLLTPPRESLKNDALRRLDAIASLEDLGAGFTLATHDLEIRGAGELLGEGQSGNMQAIGFTLYMDMLTRAVEALRSGQAPDADANGMPHGAEIDLKIPALIPDDYLPDVAIRLQLYRRIALAKNEKTLNDLQIEMIDRFGLLPAATKNLFAQSMQRLHCDTLGIRKLDATATGGRIEFSDKPNIDPLHVMRLIQKSSDTFRFDGPSCLRFTLPRHELEDRISLVKNILNTLSQNP